MTMPAIRAWRTLFVVALVPIVSITAHAADSIALHAVQIDDHGFLTVSYSKDFGGCTHLREVAGRSTHLTAEAFCEIGEFVEQTRPIEDFAFTETGVELCREDDPGDCSEPVEIVAPPHRLRFFLDCDLGGSLAEELGLPFDCDAPSQELMLAAGARLSRYAADLEAIFGKRSLRSFDFDPQVDVIFTDTEPHSGSGCPVPPPPFGYEIWVHARLTDRPDYGSYGGHMGLDQSGAGVAAGLRWDRIHDPLADADGSDELEQYWTQLDHIVHELEHVFGAGIGEYYGLATVNDTTEQTPILDVRKYMGLDDPYWGDHVDYFTDPLLNNIWASHLLGWPTSRAALFDSVGFADVTAAVVNHPSRAGFTSGILSIGATLPDPSQARVRVVDAVAGVPIAGARVSAWNVRSGYPYDRELLLDEEPTGANGYADFPWECCVDVPGCPSCFSNRHHLKLVKAVADGYATSGRWFSVYDAQAARLVDGQSELVIDLALASLPGEVTALRLDKAGDDWLTLSWDASCSTNDIDYAVYAGTLGSYTSHEKVTCSTGGSTETSFAPDPGGRYYLVAPSNGELEGSHGLTSEGLERPLGTLECRTRAPGGCR